MLTHRRKPSLKDKLFGPKKAEGIVAKVEKIIKKRKAK